ncbi:FAD-dependent oxidoreductase [Oleiharenicola lentus]|uniref:FAD-dependent oxidoreductase n=1 Tax=Oleiharenicola lentus TaxID=2508720 RepID=UPI003F662B28
MIIETLPNGNYDLIVIGGGVSGSIAAIAASRAGAKVLVVEEQGFLGGSLTAMGVGPMMSFHNPAGEQVVRGIPDEMIERLKARGASLGHIPDTTTYCSTVTPFEAEELKIELETMLIEEGGEFLYHTQLAAVEKRGDRIDSVTVCNKSGLLRLQAKMFIDATGDGDVAARVGVAFEVGREGDGAMQPMTMNLKLGNVDIAAIRQYAMEHPEDFLFHPVGQEEALRRIRSSPRLSLAGFLKEWSAARQRGEVDIPRDQVLFFETPTPGVVIVNTSRITGLDPTNPFELSHAESIGRRQCVQIFNFLRGHAVGFKNAIRMDTAAKVGVRESRHIHGRYTITADDILSARHFDDCIALGGYPIDVHAPSNAATVTKHLKPHSKYQIPLGALLPPGVENLIIVGRCISATHEAAAAFRVTPISMAIGQGGGVAAAEAVRAGTSPASVPFDKIREKLLSQGALLPHSKFGS